jgi:2'-5' RNA ligase
VAHEIAPRGVRSFIAIHLPEAVRARLGAEVARLRQFQAPVAWVRPDNFHLTLRFLGDREPAQLDQARAALDAVGGTVAPFGATVSGLGSFPPGRPPRVVWAGVTAGAADLGGLAARLEAELAPRGLGGDGRPFHPHVTLGRVRGDRGAPGLTGVLGPGAVYGDLPVEALWLMRSDLDPRGARYEVLHRASLGHSSSVDIMARDP